jgi:hypothetical protein
MICARCKADITHQPHVTLHNPPHGPYCTQCMVLAYMSVITTIDYLMAQPLQPHDRQH